MFPFLRTPQESPAPTASKKTLNNSPAFVHRFPRRIYTEDWDTKPPCAVIVTIHSQGSYDKLFRAVPQQSPDREHSVALFEMNYESIPKFVAFLLDMRAKQKQRQQQQEQESHAQTQSQCAPADTAHNAVTQPPTLSGSSSLASLTQHCASAVSLASAALGLSTPTQTQTQTHSTSSAAESDTSNNDGESETQEEKDAKADALAMQQVIDAMDLVSPASVVFNFECCTYCVRQGFRALQGKLSRLLKYLIDNGHHAMFADLSLRSLITDWNSGVLGPNPFRSVGVCQGTAKIAFDAQKLRETSGNAQLQTLGRVVRKHRPTHIHTHSQTETKTERDREDELCTAEVHCMASTLVYTLKDRCAYENNGRYELQLLSLACSFEAHTRCEANPKASDGEPRDLSLGPHKGYAGHVVLRYNTGGCLWASAMHWIELTRVEDADEESTVLSVQRLFGEERAQMLRESLANARTVEAREEQLQASVRAVIQSSAPCEYSVQPFKEKGLSRANSPLQARSRSHSVRK